LANLIEQRQAIHLRLSENEARIDALQEQLMAAQKLATMGTMACLVAHEFNNILLPMINYAELALRHQDDIKLMRKALTKTIKHGNRAAAVVQSMLGLVRNQAKDFQNVPLATMVAECFSSLARDFAKDKITVKINISDDLKVQVIPSQMQQVLVNLIVNARQAMLETGGILTIEARRKDDAGVQIEISDTGCGIESSVVDKIFEPFFSTKTNASRPDQQGTGLGLSICKDIIENHNGSIKVSSQPKQGTRFTITLPAVINEK